MAYDPFARGPFPVGVDTVTPGRGVELEVWYPAVSSSDGLDLRAGSQDRFRVPPSADEQHQQAVRDAVPRLGSFPLVLYGHRRDRHRRDWTPLCTHLASHGYVVAAGDHIGDERDWPGDLSSILDELAARRGGPGASYVDRTRVAVVGAGLGGWAALAAIASDVRIGVAAIVDPPVAGTGALDTAWSRLVPTLLVAAASALDETRELAGRLRTPRRLLAVGDEALDDVDSRAGIAAVILAHLDAHLRDLDEARELLAGELTAWLEPHGLQAAWDA